MATGDLDLTLYFRKKRTPPPSVLLLAVPTDKMPKDRIQSVSPKTELRSRQQKNRLATPHNTNSHGLNFDMHDSSLGGSGWQRHSDKIAQISAAPDVAYRNTYLDETKRQKSASASTEYRSTNSFSRSPSPRSQHSQQPQQQQQLQLNARLKTASSSSYHTSDSSQRNSYQKYRTVYDYIRESIKQIERQRNLKQTFSARVKRPQNDDVTLRRVLADRKSSSKFPSINKKADLRNPQSLVNYINHSREQIRILHTTTPNQSLVQQQQRYHRQQTTRSQNPTDSLEKQHPMLMTATVGNS